MPFCCGAQEQIVTACAALAFGQRFIRSGCPAVISAAGEVFGLPDSCAGIGLHDSRLTGADQDRYQNEAQRRPGGRLHPLSFSLHDRFLHGPLTCERLIIVPKLPGMLYVVATPIGNLDDLSPRARRVLEQAAVIAAEDTRHTGRLLDGLGIRTPLVSFHEHNEAKRSGELLRRLEAGDQIALVCDAGTPLISDPGYRLLSAARERNIKVSPVPGPCAAIAALCTSGLATDRFVFEGFLPERRSARRKYLEGLAAESRTLIFYEAPHRIRACLADMGEIFGDARPATLARELTKRYEQLYHGNLASLAARAEEDADLRRGELVIVVQGNEDPVGPAHAIELEPLLEALLAELPLKQAVKLATRLTGEPRNRVYQTAVELAREKDAD